MLFIEWFSMLQMEHTLTRLVCKVEYHILEIRKVLSILTHLTNLLVNTLHRLFKDWSTQVMSEEKVSALPLMTLETHLVSFDVFVTSINIFLMYNVIYLAYWILALNSKYLCQRFNICYVNIAKLLYQCINNFDLTLCHTQ